MGSRHHPSTMENLPGDILSNIFIRLRARQLARMRCVSKPWYYLLSQSSFVKSHLQRSIHNTNGTVIVFPKDFPYIRRPCRACPSRSPHLELYNTVELPVNQYGDKIGNLVGSVNGFICFNFGPYGDYVYYIWNPSLSAILTLPPSSLRNDDDVVDIPSRFGFDPKSDDYKVVKVTGCLQQPSMICPSTESAGINVDPKTVDFKVEVYSMRKGTWKVITQNFPSRISFLDWKSEVCVDGYDGYVHWLGNVDEQWNLYTIVAYDLDAETFHQIPLPESLLECDLYCSSVLGVMGGKLCVIAAINTKVEVWVMDEYGLAESWVKRHAFPNFYSDMTLYGFTLCNEFLFGVSDEFYDEMDDDYRVRLFYGPQSAITKIFDICIGPFIIDKIVEYVDSLVWVSPDREMSCCNLSQLQI